MSVTSAPDYSHTDAYAQGYDDGLHAARKTTLSEAVSFPASARSDVPKSQGEHPYPDVTLTPRGRALLLAIASNRQPGDGRTRAHTDVLVGCGLAAYRHGVYSVTETGEAYLAATAAEVSP